MPGPGAITKHEKMHDCWQHNKSYKIQPLDCSLISWNACAVIARPFCSAGRFTNIAGSQQNTSRTLQTLVPSYRAQVFT